MIRILNPHKFSNALKRKQKKKDFLGRRKDKQLRKKNLAINKFFLVTLLKL